MTIRAIYENGVFRPIEPVTLPERTEVSVSPLQAPADDGPSLKRIYQILSEEYDSGRPDLAERHNEHQP
ncbi:MAG: antitoxin family protein [Phycisphaerae bacterium]|nr:antitoxin family protein [Tepidisphaeraceae bacterium]